MRGRRESFMGCRECAKLYGKIVATESAPRPGGAVVLMVAQFGGRPFAADVPQIFGVFQQAMIEVLRGTDKPIGYQAAEIEQVRIGFRDEKVGRSSFDHGTWDFGAAWQPTDV